MQRLLQVVHAQCLHIFSQQSDSDLDANAIG